MIYIRKLFTQDLRDGKQIAFPKEPSYDFFKFDYQNNEADRNIEFTFETNNEKYIAFKGKKIQTRLYAAGSESRIDGELKAFIRDDLKIEIDDLLIIQSDGKNNNKFKFNVILKDDEVYPLYMKIINSANHSLIEDKGVELPPQVIDKPHNRIIFGAPGTGKSHKLLKESELYFIADEEISARELITNEIHNQPAGVTQDEWVTSIGFKYSDYIYENYLRNSSQEKLVEDFKLLPEGQPTTKRKEQLVAGVKVARRLNIHFTAMNNSTFFERVTFHPNYSYAQFVGAYKPITKFGEDKEEIAYEYVPGPFIRTFIKAKKTSQNVLLLIEEINRANVAAVFGDVFQLLDRKLDGTSEYPITTSDDLRKFLAKPENLGGSPKDYETISIPSNMYIWATMNSADQGVFPMDTAFKRRWEFEYIGINENEKEVEKYSIPICKDGKISQTVNWNELRKAVNNKLITLGINEDKLLGPFFLSKTVLDSALNKGIGFVKLFESKVLMYLFEDAAKMKAKQLFNVDEKKFIYSEVCKKFELEGLNVFKFNEGDVVEEHDIASKGNAVPTDGKLF